MQCVKKRENVSWGIRLKIKGRPKSGATLIQRKKTSSSVRFSRDSLGDRVVSPYQSLGNVEPITSRTPRTPHGLRGGP